MKKGVLLARVSTPRQEKEGLSLEEIQLPQMRQYADECGIEIDKEFTFSETADDKMRKRFHEMMSYAKKRKDIQAIIAYRVDRITRNYRDAVLCDDLRKDHDKELHFVYDRLVIHKNSSGREVSDWDTKVYLAKQQINRLRDDALESAATLLRMGRKPGKAPTGYQNVTLVDGRKDIVIDAPSKELVSEAFERYATGIYSDRTVAQIMKERGLRTKDGNVIYQGRIEFMLTNPFYVGYIRHQGKLYPHHYETFISQALFDRCQEIRRERATHGNYKPKYKIFALRGLVRCAHCGTIIGLDTKRGGSLRYVQCSRVKDRNCPQPRLHESEVISQIEDDLIPFLRVPDAILPQVQHEVACTFQPGTGSVKDRMHLLERELEQSRLLVMEAYRDSKLGRITDEHYDQLAAGERERQKALTGQLSNFDLPDREFVPSSEYLLSILNRLPELYKISDDAQKLAWHQLIFSNVVLEQKRLLWELRSPFETVRSCSQSGVWLPLAEVFRMNWRDIIFLSSRLRNLTDATW